MDLHFHRKLANANHLIIFLGLGLIATFSAFIPLSLFIIASSPLIDYTIQERMYLPKTSIGNFRICGDTKNAVYINVIHQPPRYE